MKSLKTKTSKSGTLDYIDQNPIEAFKEIGTGAADSLVNDVSKQGESDLWEKLLGAKEDLSDKFSGELSEGQEINFKSLNKKRAEEKDDFADVEPLIDYRREIIQVEQRTGHENTKVIRAKIEEILVELKKIASTSQEIAIEFKQIAVEQRIEKPGEYHLTFFEWMLSLVRSARAKIEDSSAWLSVMESKKTQRTYWNMFAKHGTTFGLSNERIVATQTG